MVAADRGFAREACGAAGAYVEADSGEGFGKAVAELLGDPERHRARSEASVLRYREVTRGWRSICEEYLGILESLGGRETA